MTKPKPQTPNSRETSNPKLRNDPCKAQGPWNLEFGFWSFLTVSDYAELERNLGYTFRNGDLLRLALTHPSVAHEKGAPVLTNQRLEFLGDAVLQLVLTQVLYEQFPAVGEG